MPRDARKVRKGLLNKGFRESEGDHKFYTFHTVQGLKTSVYTKMIHSADELSDSLLGMMARQVKLSKKDFLSLVDCSITHEAYQQQFIVLSILDRA